MCEVGKIVSELLLTDKELANLLPKYFLIFDRFGGLFIYASFGGWGLKSIHQANILKTAFSEDTSRRFSIVPRT